MSTETRRLWLAIADDPLLVATAPARVIYARHDIAGIALSGRSLLTILEQIPVDCVLLDISMPPGLPVQALPAKLL